MGGRLPCYGCLPCQIVLLRCHGDGSSRNRRQQALQTDDGITHLALHCRPHIFGIVACAALPEAARGGFHGGPVVCGCGLSIFCPMCCRKREEHHKMHQGPTGAYRGLPESSLQCENDSGILPRPKCRNIGEKEAPHLSCTWNRLITLDFKNNSSSVAYAPALLMPQQMQLV